MDELAATVSNYDVTVTLLTPLKLRATVKLSSKRSALVSLAKQVLGPDGTILTRSIATCSNCRKFEDTGLLCGDMVAAILSSNNMLPHGSTWSLYELQFATTERHTARWLEQVSVEVPLFPVEEQSTVPINPVLSWLNPPPRTGRKSKSAALRADGAVKRASARAYHCVGCGKDGHNLKSCYEIDLDAVHAAWRGQKRVPVKQLQDENSSESSVEEIESDVEEGDPDLHELFQLSFQQQVSLAVERSIQDNANALATAANLSALAMSEFGRVENKTISRDGNCMFDAARDQYATLDLRLANLTIADVRTECVEWVMARYGGTDAAALIATGKYTSWADWERQMSLNCHYGDELVYEAITNLHGGFSVKTVVGLVDRAYMKSSGHPNRPTLYFGLELDHHMWSLQEPFAVVVELEEDPVTVIASLPRKRPHFEFIAPRTGLPCCGRVHVGPGLNEEHICSLCDRVEHISCSKTKTSRHIAWICPNCSNELE